MQSTRRDGEALIHASEVIAVHFQTVVAANDYWK
ncbi:MAG: hexameric tyrosine-coordinated heme protein [Marinobacter adhaerens]